MQTYVIMNDIKNRFYASTGTLVGRENNFDYCVITENAKKIRADGFELMILRPGTAGLTK